MNPKLKQVYDAIEKWCRLHHVQFDIVADENDLQALKIFKKNDLFINELVNYASQVADNVHLKTTKVRGGTIVTFSLEAVAESTINKIIEKIGGTMSFENKINFAFEKITPTKPNAEDNLVHPEIDRIIRSRFDKIFEQSALKFAKEEEEAEESKQNSKSTTNPTLGASKGPELRFEDKINDFFGSNSPIVANNFNQVVYEALEGMATPTDQQPGDLFTKFSKALEVLGTQMGIGPIQDLLKQQGIKWKKSDDNASIILYVVNAQTKAPQPIARISSETLENPSDFEEQLSSMLDFAKGDAPGSLKQKQQELQDQQKALRDVAQSVAPKADSEVAQQMGMTPATKVLPKSS